jgi:hypothetical protein
VTLVGAKDPQLNRGLWLVKWFLAIPHFVVLALLWLVFVVLTVVAFFAILVTGRYPRGLFDLNVGILRWTWRMQFYATAAIGTDRYPPFTLDHTDYPADLDIAYPERLSRGLVLVKSWLLALPHLIVLGVLAGTWQFGDADGFTFAVGGLIGARTAPSAAGHSPAPTLDRGTAWLSRGTWARARGSTMPSPTTPRHTRTAWRRSTGSCSGRLPTSRSRGRERGSADERDDGGGTTTAPVPRTGGPSHRRRALPPVPGRGVPNAREPGDRQR